MKPFYLYILRCRDGSFYVGHTDELEERMRQHSDRQFCAYTARRHPLVLVYSCEFPTRIEALERERQIKGWTRAKKQALIRGDWDVIRQLARGPSRERSPRASTPAPLRAASAQRER